MENLSISRVFIGEKEVEPCQNANVLGIVVDSRFNISAHIAKVSGKASSGLFIHF